MAGSACVSRSPDGIRAMQADVRSTPWWGGRPDVSRLGRENRRGGYVGRDAHHSRSAHPLTAPVPAQVRGVASVAGRARVEQSPHREPDILADRAWAESEALRQNANAHLLGGRRERILKRSGCYANHDGLSSGPDVGLDLDLGALLVDFIEPETKAWRARARTEARRLRQPGPR